MRWNLCEPAILVFRQSLFIGGWIYCWIERKKKLLVGFSEIPATRTKLQQLQLNDDNRQNVISHKSGIHSTLLYLYDSYCLSVQLYMLCISPLFTKYIGFFQVDTSVHQCLSARQIISNSTIIFDLYAYLISPSCTTMSIVC